MTGTIDSRHIIGAEREGVLRALARCKHSRRFGYRTCVVALIGIHKDWPEAAYDNNQADALDLLRFVYRHQLKWPIGIYEPPISRVSMRAMGLASQIKLNDGTLIGAQNAHGEPVWRRWDGYLPSPLSEECCV